MDAGLVAINDPDAIVLFDESNSTNEDRYIAIGRKDNMILFVSFTMRDDYTMRGDYTMRDEVERIISVRKAEREEEELYWTGVV